MEKIKRIASTNKAIWNKLLDAVKTKYVYTWEFTSACVLLLWTGNNESYARWSS